MAYPDRRDGGSVVHWREGAVAHLRFNRPQALNALDVPMTAAFHAACVEIAADPAVRVLVIAGEGRAFLAGGDVAAMAAAPLAAAQDLIREVHGAITVLNRIRVPVIAQVHGAAAGAAIGVLMACDLVAAAEGSKFSLAFPAVGASADSSSTWGLPRMMGLRNALRFALLGEAVDAAQAREMGLISAVLPAPELAPTVGQCGRPGLRPRHRLRWPRSSACCAARSTTRWPTIWTPKPRPFSPARARTTSPRAPPPSWASGRRSSKGDD